MLIVIVLVVLGLAGPVAAVPMVDHLELSEALTVVVLHGGPACSSGWHPDASGLCVSDEATAPAAWLPVLEGPTVALDAGPDPAMVPNPEPATVLLWASALAWVGWQARRRRT